MSQIASIRFSDLLSLAWSALRRNRLRSILTVGAIAVGISVMMYLISFGLGLEQLTVGNVSRSSSLLSITVNSGSEKLRPLNQQAMQKIAQMPKVKQVLPQVTAKGQATLDQTAEVTIIGIDPDYLQAGDPAKLTSGQLFHPDDQQTMLVSSGFLKLFGLDEHKTPLVSFGLAFDKDDYPGLAPVTNLSVSGVVDSSALVVYLPRLYLESLLPKDGLLYANAKVTVASLDDIQPVSDNLIANGFKVTRVVDTIDEIKKVFFWIQAVMGALGLIAIFVASIGMFNTLTISLLERTKEIGIMKALGVKRSDIRRLFMLESYLIGLVGGLIGIALTFFFQQITLFLLSLLASLAQGVVPTVFLTPWYAVAGFLAFALFIAGLTGIYPASRASKINPIEAIRYE